MGATVKELQRRMESAEFTEHLADYELEPWGDDWKQAALIAASLYAVNGKEKRVEEFIPGRIAERQQSIAEMKYRLETAFKAIQKRQERKSKRDAEGKTQ